MNNFKITNAVISLAVLFFAYPVVALDTSCLAPLRTKKEITIQFQVSKSYKIFDFRTIEGVDLKHQDGRFDFRLLKTCLFRQIQREIATSDFPKDKYDQWKIIQISLDPKLINPGAMSATPGH